MTDAPSEGGPGPERTEGAPAPAPRTRRPLPVRIALWAGGVLLAVVALVAAAAVGIDTAPGHRLLASVIEGRRPPNGLRVRIGRLDGSLYGRLTVRDLRLSDQKGLFLDSPAVTVDWAPSALLSKHVWLRELSTPLVRLLRVPEFKASAPKPNQPVLPDIHLTLDRLYVARLVLEPAVTGDRRALSIHDSVELQHRRVRVEAVVDAEAVDGHAGGDALRLRVDAEPSANRLRIEAHLRAPQGGVVDRLAKLDAPLSFDLDGRGTWSAWNGRAVSTLGGAQLLDAAITARSGLFTVKGRAQPSLVVKAGPVAALTAPALAFDVSGRLQDRQLDLDGRLGSDAFDLAAKGRLDLARSRYLGVRVDARLLKPQAASPKLSGQDVKAALVLDGAFAGRRWPTTSPPPASASATRSSSGCTPKPRRGWTPTAPCACPFTPRPPACWACRRRRAG